MFQMLFAQESSNGTVHSFVVETGAPTVGFRPVNTGHANAAGTSTRYNIDLKVLDATAQEDAALADAYKDGPEMFMAKRALRNLAAGFSAAEKQFIYGTDNDADGFVGLAEAAAYLFQDSEKVIDGGGSGSAVQSAWIIRTGEDDLSVVYNGDTPMTIDDIVPVLLNQYSDGNAVAQFPGYMTKVLTWLALQIGSKHSVCRVANLDLTGTNFEDKIQDGLATFPSDRPATHIVVSRAGRRAIQNGRTSYNALGIPAQLPTEIDGVPIVISEALVAETAIENAP
jgi:hypothetical protein